MALPLIGGSIPFYLDDLDSCVGLPWGSLPHVGKESHSICLPYSNFYRSCKFTRSPILSILFVLTRVSILVRLHLLSSFV